MTAASAPALFQTHFPISEFAQRRARLLALLDAGATVVLKGAPAVAGFNVFRQTNDFYYLCGVEVPGAYLRCDAAGATLYLSSQAVRDAANEGETLAGQPPEAVAALTGVQAVRPVDALAEDLAAATIIYTPFAPGEMALMARDTAQRANRTRAEDPWDAAPTREGLFIDKLRARYFKTPVRDCSPALDSLRLIKSPLEIELLRVAARLTGEGLLEALRHTRVGVSEYELAARATYRFLAGGARGEGYRPIAAAGPSIWYSHYYRNDRVLQDGDLMLLDYAPDYAYYTSDIGRMWPANGRYTPLQRELYGFVVEYHQTLLRHICPGLTPERILEETAEEMAPVLEHTMWSKPIYEAAARRFLVYPGHLSHPVGMAVHDVGDYRGRPLEPGLVLTVDPQYWAPEERLYLRCEDTVVVTNDGIENLTGFVPLELGEMEELVGSAR